MTGWKNVRAPRIAGKHLKHPRSHAEIIQFAAWAAMAIARGNLTDTEGRMILQLCDRVTNSLLEIEKAELREKIAALEARKGPQIPPLPQANGDAGQPSPYSGQ